MSNRQDGHVSQGRQLRPVLRLPQPVQPVWGVRRGVLLQPAVRQDHQQVRSSQHRQLRPQDGAEETMYVVVCLYFGEKRYLGVDDGSETNKFE